MPSEDADLSHAKVLRLDVVDGCLGCIEITAVGGLVLRNMDCVFVPAMQDTLPEPRDISPRVRIAASQR